jgi:glutamate dehydrogenase/leucine dehydrogenase
VRQTWSAVWEYAQRCSMSLERAAMAIAIGKVAQAMRMG